MQLVIGSKSTNYPANYLALFKLVPCLTPTIEFKDVVLRYENNNAKLCQLVAPARGIYPHPLLLFVLDYFVVIVFYFKYVVEFYIIFFFLHGNIADENPALY